MGLLVCYTKAVGKHLKGSMCINKVKTFFIISFGLFAIFCVNSTVCCAQAPATKKSIINYTINDDRREFVRINTNKMKYPIQIKTSNDELQVIDISRGGIAIKNNNKYSIGDIIPVKISYRGLEITPNIKIVRLNSDIIGAEFATNETAIDNQLIYLSIKLESDNGQLVTRFSENGVL